MPALGMGLSLSPGGSGAALLFAIGLTRNGQPVTRSSQPITKVR